MHHMKGTGTGLNPGATGAAHMNCAHRQGLLCVWLLLGA